MSKRHSLIRKSLGWYTLCVVVVLVVLAPLFYWLTVDFYAQDMIDTINAVNSGQPIPPDDTEEDVVEGIMMQYALIVMVLAVATLLTIRLVQRRLWRPFYDMLGRIEHFRIESGRVPPLAETDTEEFARLGQTLTRLMTQCADSYRAQREFTENASHELQTPLAVLTSRMDLLAQEPQLTRRQAEIIGESQEIVSRMSRLTRNLLLLAKMDNGQYRERERIDLVGLLTALRPYMETLTGDLALVYDLQVGALRVEANRPLVESLVTNLVVNAIRHNRPGGEVRVTVDTGGMAVENTSLEPALDGERIFRRFYQSAGGRSEGNGLGLAIVRAVCDYHGWTIHYIYKEGRHRFELRIKN